MEIERWQKLEAIYHSALAVEINEREEFLRKICIDDSLMFNEAKALLAEEEKTKDFLEDDIFDIGIEILASNEKLKTNMSSQIPNKKISDIIDDRYEIVQQFDEGGIGQVHKAVDRKLNRPVIIKVLKKEHKDRSWIVEKFRDEGFATSRINHPNIVTVFDHGEMPDGSKYLVVEFIEGNDLKKFLTQARAVNEPIPFETVAEIMRQVGGAVEAIHQARYVHRDLKPANLMLTKASGDILVKVIDFGIVRNLDDETVLGKFAGSLLYASPEQLNGKDVTAKSDIFSLGVIAYELLTQRIPFKSQSNGDGYIKIASQIRLQQEGLKLLPTDLRSDVPKAAGDLINRALSFDPEQRFDSAKEFGNKLAEALTVKNVAVISKDTEKSFNFKWLFAVGGFAAIILVIFAGWYLLNSNTESITGDKIVGSRVKTQTLSGNTLAANNPNSQASDHNLPSTDESSDTYDVESGFPTGKAPQGTVYAQIGTTFWRSRPATSQDDRDIIARETVDTEESVSERKDELISNGEKIYLSVESLTDNFLPDKGGYVYVVNRELYTDGTFGGARLIFPTLRTYEGKNLIKPGQPVLLPRAGGKPFEIRRSRPDQVAETYTIIVSPWQFKLPESIGEKAMVLPNGLVEEWEKQFGGKMYKAVLRNGIGKPQTIREQKVVSRETIDTAEPLTQTDPLPQTVYKGAVKIGNPAIIMVALRYKD